MPGFPFWFTRRLSRRRARPPAPALDDDDPAPGLPTALRAGLPEVPVDLLVAAHAMARNGARPDTIARRCGITVDQAATVVDVTRSRPPS